MKKSLKIASAVALCSVFALTLTFCGSKTETVETGDTTTVVEPAPADTTAADTTATDTTAVQ